jgi:hypothetical protein
MSFHDLTYQSTDFPAALSICPAPPSVDGILLLYGRTTSLGRIDPLNIFFACPLQLMSRKLHGDIVLYAWPFEHYTYVYSTRAIWCLYVPAPVCLASADIHLVPSPTPRAPVLPETLIWHRSHVCVKSHYTACFTCRAEMVDVQGVLLSELPTRVTWWLQEVRIRDTDQAVRLHDGCYWVPVFPNLPVTGTHYGIRGRMRVVVHFEESAPPRGRAISFQICRRCVLDYHTPVRPVVGEWYEVRAPLTSSVDIPESLRTRFQVQPAPLSLAQFQHHRQLVRRLQSRICYVDNQSPLDMLHVLRLRGEAAWERLRGYALALTRTRLPRELRELILAFVCWV